MSPSATIQASIEDFTADSDATTTLRTRSSVTLSNDSASTSRLSDETTSESGESSTSEDDGSDSENDEISTDHLSSLLQKARSAVRSNAAKLQLDEVPFGEQDHIKIGDDQALPNLPTLNLGSLPTSYTTLPKGKGKSPASYRNLDTEAIIQQTVDISAPAPPEASRVKLSKKERQALKAKTAGAGWFDLPAPAEADLPRLYREVEALRLRNQLDPKRFYRKDEGEGKGIKGLPKHFAIGTIIATRSPFAPGAQKDSSTRKRTLVDELVDDAEARSYAKKKFRDLQADRGARGRGTLAKRKQGRREKW